jgi:hypothetical protein
MGEYVKNIQGEEVKIGTCENLYYCRYSDKEMLLNADEYFDEKNGFRYRFPFPDEDNKFPGDYDPYGRGFEVLLLEECSPTLIDDLREENYHHNTLTHNVNNMNIFVPCPLSHGFSLKTSAGGPQNVVKIVQQKLVEGNLWTVIECGYCGAKVRIDLYQAQELCNSILQHIEMIKDPETKMFYQQIVFRVMAGYRMNHVAMKTTHCLS